MAILAFRFVSAAFLACFLRKEDNRALSSLLLEALGGGSREADGKEADGKVVYSKDTGKGKVGSKKVRGFLVDFALFIFLSFTKFYKERFSTYFLQSH